MAIPKGATAGVGIINLVNVKFNNQASTVYQQQFFYQAGSNPCTLVARYVDIPGGYATFVGSHSGISYGKAILDSVYCNSPRLTYILSLDLLQSDYSSNAANHGTSKYTSGYAPVPTVSPTGKILRVGSTREYTTVLAAYNAAAHGDDIIIDAGTYNCNAFYGGTGGTVLTKCVRFWGATEDPDDVILTNDGSCTYGCHFFKWYPYYMSNVPTSLRAPGFFHVTLSRAYGDTWETTHDIMGEAGTDINPYVPPADNAIMFSCNT